MSGLLDISRSPAKPSAPGESRESLTEKLRNSDLAHQLSTNDFTRILFLHAHECQDYDKYNTPSARKLARLIGTREEKAAYEPICDLFNGICDQYAREHNVGECDALRFVVHADNPPCHHPRSYTDKVATQKPDIVVVKKLLALLFVADVASWMKLDSSARSQVNKPAIAWPYIPSILEGKGRSDPNALFQAGIYLGSLTQARPDMIGCFGLSFSPTHFRVLWCDASGVYYTEEIRWTSNKALPILVQYVHHLHIPSLDPSISLRPPKATYDGRDFRHWTLKSYASPPVWHVTGDCDKVYIVDSVISVGHAWSRKNWVVRATHTVGPDGDEPLPVPVVIKDSFQREERLPSSEGAILAHIHQHGHVPGVMEKLADFVVTRDKKQIENVRLPDDMDPALRFPNRVKYRLILVGSATGYIFTACSSVQDALMMIYDALEMSIVLHRNHKVTHRDIGMANILRRPDTEIQTQTASSSDGGTSWRPVFVRQLLAFREAQPALYNSPTCLLIDFDNAYLEGRPTGALRTTSALFVARSISLGKLLHENAAVKAIPQLSGTAKEAYIRIHGQDTYDERSTFHDNAVIRYGAQPFDGEPLFNDEELTGFEDDLEGTNDGEGLLDDAGSSDEEELEARLPHVPRHDAESCYWVVVVFAFLALPADSLGVRDDTTVMSTYLRDFEQHCLGDVRDARSNVFNMGDDAWKMALHPRLRSLAPFLVRLSEVVQPEYGRSETPLDNYHLHEAMKRILWQEIWRLHASGKPIALNREQQRRPKLKQDAHSASASIDHVARTAEASASGTGNTSKARTGKRARADGPSDTPSASTSEAADGKQKKRKTAKERPVTAPTRTSTRQRQLRGE